MLRLKGTPQLSKVTQLTHGRAGAGAWACPSPHRACFGALQAGFVKYLPHILKLGLGLVPKRNIVGFLPQQAPSISLGVGINTEEVVCIDPT